MLKSRFLVFHLDDGKELRGGQRQMLYLAKELTLLGQENVIVCRKNSPLYREAARLGLRTFTLPYIFEWDLVSASRLVNLIKRENGKQARCVILHSHTSHTAAHAWIAGLGLDCIRIVHRRVDFKPGGGLSARLKYGGAAKVIAISKAVRETLIRAGVPPGKIAIINSSIDLDVSPWRETGFKNYRIRAREKISALFGIEKDAFWTGALIALDPSKNPLNLVRSAKIVLDSRPGTQFLLAGQGKLDAQARALAKSLGVASNLHFLGYYPKPYELLSALDLFVMPSSTEGMGSVLLETMNAGVPIVATCAGGITDVVEDGKNGLLAPINDPLALAAAQLRIMSEPGLAGRLTAEGRARLAEFSSAKMAGRMLRLYEEAAACLKTN